jgi:hypothetical protein
MLGRSTQTTKNLKESEMPKTGGKRRPLERTQKAKKIRPGAPLLETRARSILSTMVGEVAAELSDLQLPEAPPPEVSSAPREQPLPSEADQSLDDFPASDLAAIARQGASLEVDGAKHDVVALVALAKSVTDDAYLKINNSGTFTAAELALIARSSPPGQVIFA